MARHEVSFSIPERQVLRRDVAFTVKSNGSKLGELLISKGNVEWVPAHAKEKKRRMSWEKFAELMDDEGRVKRMKK